MMSKWRFGATVARSGLTCSVGMSVVALALLVAVGCGGELARARHESAGSLFVSCCYRALR